MNIDELIKQTNEANGTNIVLSTLLPDPVDPRDFIFESDKDVILPESVDLRKFTGFAEDQGGLGACTGEAVASGAEAYLNSAGLFVDTENVDSLDMAPLFNYSDSRILIGLFGQDNGSTLRAALRSMKNNGICRETVWPYIESNVEVKPSDAAYADAANYKLDSYFRVSLTYPRSLDDALYDIKFALAKGWPVVVAMRVGQKIFGLTPQDQYTYVNPTINPYVGNHALFIVGYVVINGILYWIIKNSWGKNWCMNGYFLCMATIPLVDCQDIWVMKGFNGIERVGQDQTQPKPAPDPVPVPPPAPAPTPTPTPVPVDPPAPPVPPQPDPVPPAPPQPEPVPPPAPTPPAPENKSSNNNIVIIVAVIAGIAFAIAKSLGYI